MPKLKVVWPSGRHAYSADDSEVDQLVMDGVASPIYNRKGTRLLGCRLTDGSARRCLCSANQTTVRELIIRGKPPVYRHSTLNSGLKLTNPKGWDADASSLGAISSAEAKRGPSKPPPQPTVINYFLKSINRQGTWSNLQPVANE